MGAVVGIDTRPWKRFRTDGFDSGHVRAPLRPCGPRGGVADRMVSAGRFPMTPGLADSFTHAAPFAAHRFLLVAAEKPADAG
eukprot:gene2416-biopygen85